MKVNNQRNDIQRFGVPFKPTKYCDIEFECLKTGNPNLNETMNLYLFGADVLSCSGKILEVIETQNSYKVKGEMFI